MGKKRYKCLYDLTDNCEARKFVEESTAKGIKEISNIFQKAGVSLSKFDDRQVAFDMGEALGSGISETLKPLVKEIEGHDTIRKMSDFCLMCPTRIKEAQKRSYP